MTTKIVQLILALLFLSFAFVQINDPDPLIWILIYGNMAVLCVLAMFKIRFRIWLILSALVYFVWAATLIPGALEWWQSSDRGLLFDDIAKMQHPYIEETREFLGLWICLVVLAIQWVTGRR